MTNFLKLGKLEKDLERQKADYEKNTKSYRKKQQRIRRCNCSKSRNVEKISNYSAENKKQNS